MARTIVYIDGFNLYYRALKGTPHKWLDIEAMSRAALPHTCTIERVNYYTAHFGNTGGSRSRYCTRRRPWCEEQTDTNRYLCSREQQTLVVAIAK